MGDPGHDVPFDKRYPVGIRIGNLNLLDKIPDLTVRTTNFFAFRANGGSTRPKPNYWADPAQLTFHRLSKNPDHNGQPLLPIVIYRQQITNAMFPKVSGSLVQVTPLIERIPYSLYVNADQTIVTVPDLLIESGFEYSQSLDGNLIPNYYLYVRDLQPVMVGASYQYFVMRMNEKHEVSEIIDAGIVTIFTL